ncbi:YciI family protein [Allorhizocola rhizosphaerae]|uniref:YciI family protein n=1 Tax=Allorhizocola rhizosphaerae TaxID=1872709 RepID=UPI000E3BEFB6|nr:YciI family protein [Allorhizocola rhizosphaerae]
MIVVELAFTPDDRRLAARPAHRERLAALHKQGRLLAAGPLADDSGALLVFTTDEETLTRIMAEDPYYTTPGVTVVSQRSWNPVVGP